MLSRLVAIRIFLSSVQSEFQAERRALREAIERIGDFCVCMEGYGAVSTGPREHDDRLVAECDLWACLVGTRYGSLDPETGKSYTELEFDAAEQHRLPCLVYVRQPAGVEVEPRQADFIRRLKQPERIVAPFSSGEELRAQFLIDLVRELRTTLLDKFALEPLGPLSWKTVHTLTAGMLDRQVEVVGGDRYASELCVRRDLETAIDEFVELDARTLARCSQILATLRLIAGEYALGARATDALTHVEWLLQRGLETETASARLAATRDAFHYDDVRALIGFVEQMIGSTMPGPQAANAVEQRLRGLPFLRSGAPGELHYQILQMQRTGKSAGTFRSGTGLRLSEHPAEGDGGGEGRQ